MDFKHMSINYHLALRPPNDARTHPSRPGAVCAYVGMVPSAEVPCFSVRRGRSPGRPGRHFLADQEGSSF